MDDPKHLVEETMDDFEAELLRAGRNDAMPARSRRHILSALGVMTPFMLDASLSEAAPPPPGPSAVTPETTSGPATSDVFATSGLPGDAALGGVGAAKGAASVGIGKALLVGIGTSSIGAAALWAGVHWSSPVTPTVVSTVPPAADVQGTEEHGGGAEEQHGAEQNGAEQRGAEQRGAEGPRQEPIGELPPAAPPQHTAQESAAPEEPSAAPAGEARSTLGSSIEPRPAVRRHAPSGNSRDRSAPTETAGADSLARELAAIETARRALASDDPAEALRRLQRYDQRFPQGRLRTERTVLMIEALVKNGNRTRASQLGQSFLERSPNGPYAQRIRSLLGLPPQSTP